MAEARSTSAPKAAMSTAGVLAFACAYMPYAALQLSVTVQLPPFFASQLGLGLAAGAAFGIVRLIDIPVDPILGLLIDRTRTRFGRYRPWVIAGVPVMILAIYMLYQARPGVGEGYLVLWLLVIYLGMSVQLVAGNAWASTLAASYTGRSKIFGAMLGMGVVGAVMSLVIPALAAGRHMDELHGMRAVGWFLLALVPASTAIAMMRTPERVAEPDQGKPFRMGDYVALLSRGNVLRILCADFCVTMGPGWMAALYIFYFRDSRQMSLTAGNLLLALYILAGLAGGPAAAWLANRISKHRALIVTTTFYSLALIIIPLLPRGQPLPAVLPMFLLGALATGFVVMVRAITADVSDELRLEGGRDLTGLLYAVTSATTKAASALSIFVSFALLGAIGYDARAHAVNGPAQIHGLELIYIIGPIVFVMLGGAAFVGYQLSAERHAEIRRKLDARDALIEESLGLEGIAPHPGDLPIARALHGP